MTMTPRAIASAAAQNTDECWLVLLRITHPSLSEDIAVVCNNDDVVSEGITYTGLFFTVDLPSENDSSGEFTVRLDNVSREVIDAVNSVTSKPSATLAVILADDPDNPVITFDAVAVSFEADPLEISATFRADDLLYEPYPGVRFTPASHPGLFGFILFLFCVTDYLI